MNQTQDLNKDRFSFWKILSGLTLVVGTSIGGGMLGIPLVTAEAGFIPATFITSVVGLFMLGTGLLFLEVALWMPMGANILSMTGQFLGRQGKFFCAGLFLFLYYCLLIAYVAAGGSLLGNFITQVSTIKLQSSSEILLFGFIYWAIVNLGHRIIDRTNLILSIGMLFSFIFFIGSSVESVQPAYLKPMNFTSTLFAIPVLFSSFGYHNIVPSLCTYFKKDKFTLKWSLWLGIAITTIVYLVWQFLFIGIIPESLYEELLLKGEIATQGLSRATGNPLLVSLGSIFAFFAISTSLLGVSFSMIDFYYDGLNLIDKKPPRLLVSAITFIPPIIFCLYNPQVFDKALGVAGGIGEALLNGLLPVLLVWIGRYYFNKTNHFPFFSKPILILFLLFSFFVTGLEFYILFY